MLGGSLWVAVLRNGLGVILMMAVFLLLDHPRLSTSLLQSQGFARLQKILLDIILTCGQVERRCLSA